MKRTPRSKPCVHAKLVSTKTYCHGRDNEKSIHFFWCRCAHEACGTRRSSPALVSSSGATYRCGKRCAAVFLKRLSNFDSTAFHPRHTARAAGQAHSRLAIKLTPPTTNVLGGRMSNEKTMYWDSYWTRRNRRKCTSNPQTSLYHPPPSTLG